MIVAKKSEVVVRGQGGSTTEEPPSAPVMRQDLGLLLARTGHSIRLSQYPPEGGKALAPGDRLG